MKLKMELLSDTIFGNGVSVPGGEDISILTDKNGFPYYKGSTFKGVFREELENYLTFIGSRQKEIVLEHWLGIGGSDVDDGKLVFGDFTLSDYVKEAVLKEIGVGNNELITSVFSNLRTFTSINDNGIAQEGTLRIARCVNKGFIFYSDIWVRDEVDALLVAEVISMIKWIGTMRNKGFGKVKISVVGEKEKCQSI